MSEDIYANPDLTKKVRFQKSENEDKNTGVYDDTDNSANKDNSPIYDNYWVEGSTLPKMEDSTTEDQQQIVSVTVNSRKRNLVRAAAVFLVLLCLLLLAAVIVLLIQYTSLNTTFSNENGKLQRMYCEMKTLNANLTTERDELQTNYSKVQSLNANLTTERDHLQTNYSQVQSLNANLTQRTKQLENETDFLNDIISNLTQQRDGLKKQLETSCCPVKCKIFGNSCLFISSSTKNWIDSKKSCEDLAAQLVIINSREKQDFITSLNQDAWIGLTDQQNVKVWKWVDGTVANTTFWGNKQPDNYQGQEHCAEITHNNSPPNNWNDLPCSETLNFICEKIMQ